MTVDRIPYLVSLQLFGVNLFTWGFLSVFMIYPVSLFDKKYIFILLIPFFVFFINSSLQIINLPFHTYLFHFFFAALFFYYLQWMQWRKSQYKPIEHAVVRLFLLIMVIPVVLVFMLWIVPRIFHDNEIISHDSARFIFIPIMLAWALAVFRYRLFNVTLWWFKSLLWLGGGLLVFCVDVLLVYLLKLQPLSALSLALLLAGFIYFPARQYVLSRFLSPTQASLSTTIYTLQKATTDEQFQSAWKQILIDRFDPIKIETLNQRTETIRFLDEGLVLSIPDVVYPVSYHLSGKHQGNSLFNQQDVQASDSLLSLSQAVLHASKAREEAIISERTRIMRDLHDSLGAKLLAMVQRYRGHDSVDDAREALQLLRDTVHLSIMAEPVDLEALLGEWRMETRERVEISDACLHWQESGLNTPELMSSASVLLLRGFLREAVNNALKHAQPINIFVFIERSSGALHWRICNDGKTSSPNTWRLGFGLSHLRERFQRAGGSLTFSLDTQSSFKRIEIHAILPDKPLIP